MLYIIKYGEYDPNQPRVSRIAGVLQSLTPIKWVVSTSKISENVIAVGEGSKRKFLSRAVSKLKQIAKPEDILYGYMHIGALAAWRASKKTGAKFVYDYPDPWNGWYFYKTPQDSLKWKIGRRVFYFLEKMMYWDAKAVLTASYAQLEFLRSQHRTSASQMMKKSKSIEEVIINSPDLDRFKPAKQDAKLLKELGLKGKRVLIYQGYVGYEYGIDLIIDMMKYLSEKRKDVFLIILGRYGDQKYFDFLSRKISEENLQDFVMIHKPVPYTEMPRYLSLPEIGFVPFRQRFYNAVGGPNKLFEYMSCGIVPVCANMIEFRKHVSNGRNGALVYTERPKEVAEVVNDLLNKPKLLKEIKERNREKVEGQYHWGIQVEKIRSVLEALK